MTEMSWAINTSKDSLVCGSGKPLAFLHRIVFIGENHALKMRAA